jgi:hypothetical protein
MTTLVEKTKAIQEVMVHTKTTWVASGPEETDLAFYIHLFRGDELVGVVITRTGDRDTLLKAATLAAPGFAATTVTVTFESWHTTLAKSPLTDEDWRANEMQYIADTDPLAFEKGWLTECVTTVSYDRDGAAAMVSQAYRIKDEEILWEDPEVLDGSDGNTVGGGYMSDYLSNLMTKEAADVLEQKMKELKLAQLFADATGMTPEQQRFHMDAAVMTTLMERKLVEAVILGAEEGSARQTWIEERFGSSAQQ